MLFCWLNNHEIIYHSFQKNIKQQKQFSMLIIRIINNWAPIIIVIDHQISIKLISEGSCDTEDWSNGC